MAFCGSLHHTANQRTSDLLYTYFLLVITVIGHVLSYLNYSSFKIKLVSRS